MEYQNFPSKVFCLTMPEIFAGEPFCAVSQKISGSEKFMDIQGEYQDFPSKIFFCLTMPKFVEWESFSVAVVSGTGKVWIRKGVEYEIFPSKNFCLTETKIFARQPFSAVFQEISGSGKVYG